MIHVSQPQTPPSSLIQHPPSTLQPLCSPGCEIQLGMAVA